MPQFRHLGAAAATVAGALVVTASVAAAHPGHKYDHVFMYGADGEVDVLRCGAGDDSYTADDIDIVAPSCEDDITPVGP